MFGHLFYYQLMKNYINLFGSYFSDIVIRRQLANNQVIQTIPVPITYGPKTEYVVLDAEPVQDRKVAVQFPRMAFEMTNIAIDASRNSSVPLNKIIIYKPDNTVLTQYCPVPYKLHFNLYIGSKNLDDMFQILEQIYPFFRPDFSTSLRLIEQMGTSYNIRTNLLNTAMEDIYSNSDLRQRRALIYTLTFDMDVWFFGPIQRSGLIKRVQIDFEIPPGSGPITAEEVRTTGRSSRVVIMPGLTANGQPTTTSNNSIGYQLIQPTDNFGYIVQDFTYFDGLKFDPVTLSDELPPKT